MPNLKNTKIGTKLPVTMVVLVVLTVLILTVASMFMTRSIIKDAIETKMRSVATLKADRIEVLLQTIERDLRLQAEAPAISQALIALTDGYDMLGDEASETLRRVYITENPHPLGQKDALVKADTGSSYGFIHAIYHPTLDELQNQMEYYDVFLIDPEGNLVYSVFKENDFATNLADGQWRDSGLAEAFRQAVSNDANAPSVYVDFAPYEPSNFAPAAFMARPVFDQQGKLLGVLAYQMPIDQLNSAARDLRALGQTADGFIIGSDGLMRTDSVQTEADDILNTTVDAPYVTESLTSGPGNFTGIGLTGAEVMGYHIPIQFGPIDWVLVVQQEKGELFVKLPDALLKSALISLLIVGLATVASIAFSRGLSGPLRRLTQSVAQVADGDLDAKVHETERGDEIGELARATEVFRQNAVEMDQLNEAQKKAAQELEALNAEKERAAEREAELTREKEAQDQAAIAERAEMMRTLGDSIGAVVQDAKAGNFSSRITAQFDDETLQTLSSNINEVLEAVDTGLGAAGKALSRIAEGDLTHGMEGEFQGAFSVLQDNTNAMAASLKDLIGGIAGSTENLAHSSSELRDTSDALSRQAEQNASALEETSAALEELSASIKQVNHNVSSANENARVASDNANSGSTVAAEAADAMNRINEASGEISKVVGVINDISFQINLLALNAGVEAARAGEAGRGFSVVASEVRQLAQRANEAAKEIAAVITRSDAAVSDGVTKVQDAGTSLKKISDSVTEVSSNIEEIAQAIAEQVDGVADINTAVSQIDQNTQQQAASFEEVTAASGVLSGEAEGLKQSINRFNTGATVTRLPKAAPRPAPPALAPKPQLKQTTNVAEPDIDDGWEEF